MSDNRKDNMTDKKAAAARNATDNAAAAPTSQAQQFPFSGWWQTAKMDWPKMDWPKMDWPKMDWPTAELPKVSGFDGAAMQAGMDEGVARMEVVLEELDTLTRQGAKKAAVAIDETARLCKSSLDYSLDLQAKAQVMWLDGARKMVAAMRSATPAGA